MVDPTQGPGRAANLTPDSAMTIAPPSPATNADLDEMRGKFRDSMRGEEFANMPAARYDPDPRGVFEQPSMPQGVTERPPQVEQESFLPAPETGPPNYQNLYGRSQNELGEWRSLAQQSTQTALALQQQLQQQIAQIQATQYQVPQQQAPVQEFNLFGDKPAGELLTWGEANERFNMFVRQELLPALDMKSRQAQDLATARAQRMLPQWDVHPNEEAQALTTLRAKFPGFEQRFTATEINSMVIDQATLMRQGRSPVQPVAPTATAVGNVASPPPRPVFVDPNRIVRQQTYIESAPPAQIRSEPSVYTDPRQAFGAEIAAVEKQLGRRTTAPEYKAIMEKHGFGTSVNDFGPDIATR